MSSVDVQTQPQQSPAIKPTGRTYEWLNATLAQLARACGDQQDTLALQIAQAYLQLGLAAPAQEMLETVGDAVRAQPGFTEMLRRIHPSRGRRAWASGDACLKGNLEILARRNLDTDAIQARWHEVRRQYEWFTDVHGVDHVRHRNGNDTPTWLPLIGDHLRLAEAAALPPDIEQLMPGPYLFEGLDLGWFFARLWKRTRDTFLGYSSALYVVEPDPALLALVLHLHDWREILADPRVMFFLGPDGGRRFQQALDDDPNLAIPTQAYRLYAHQPAAGLDTRSAITAVIEIRSQRATEGKSAIEARYQTRDASYWARRYRDALAGTGPPLRVLAPVSTHTSFLQYSMRDAKQAVESLGHEFHLITESTPYEKTGVETYHRAILDFDPDLFLVIDHLRPGFAAIIPANLPMMTWDQDALPGAFTEEKVRRMSPLDTVVGLPHYECLGRMGCDPRQFLAATMPTNLHTWDSSNVTEAELDSYRCDISYVSHASQTAEEFHDSEVASYNNPGIGQLLKDMYPIAVERVESGDPINGHLMRTVLARSELHTGVRIVDPELRHRLIGWHLWRLCDRVFRHQALQWVAAWAQEGGRSFRIYGNGWDNHPTLAPFAAGPAANGHELLCIYRASKINLQLMPAGFIHQRALDGLAAGGFFLTRRSGGDVRDPHHVPLLAKIQRMNLNSGREVHESEDETVRRDFQELCRRHGYSESELEEAYHFLCIDTHLDYSADVFPEFSEVSFTDAASFCSAANRFLDSVPDRRRVTDEMRRVVVERYAYDTTMRRFLSFAADYFAALDADSNA